MPYEFLCQARNFHREETFWETWLTGRKMPVVSSQTPFLQLASAKWDVCRPLINGRHKFNGFDESGRFPLTYILRWDIH